MTGSGRIRPLFEERGFLPLLKSGRWALAAIESALSVALIAWFPARPAGAFAGMGLLLAYNALVLSLLYRWPLARIPLRLILALDFVFLANVCLWTDRSLSPFLGLFHLLVLVSALFFDLAGGLLGGLLAGGIALGLTLVTPGAVWELTRDTAPYFPIVGGFTGLVSQRMKVWQAQLRESETAARLRHNELELASAVQRSTLALTPPSVPGFALAVRAVPSREVGGDFHVFVTESAERLGIALGDVSGKGMAAALTATSIGYLLPHLCAHGSPGAMLATLHADLHRRLPSGAFVGMLYVEFSLAAHDLMLWNAGHTPAWIEREGVWKETHIGAAPPLGVFPQPWSAAPETLALAPGETLVLCSDGLLETRSAAGEEFGPGRMAGALTACAALGPEALADALLAAVRAFGEPSDDVTLIVARRNRYLLAAPGTHCESGGAE